MTAPRPDRRRPDSALTPAGIRLTAALARCGHAGTRRELRATDRPGADLRGIYNHRRKPVDQGIHPDKRPEMKIAGIVVLAACIAVGVYELTAVALGWAP